MLLSESKQYFGHSIATFLLQPQEGCETEDSGAWAYTDGDRKCPCDYRKKASEERHPLSLGLRQDHQGCSTKTKTV